VTNWFEVSKAGMELVQRFEGCAERLPDGRFKAYQKPGDPWTVGWGITGHLPDGRKVQEGLIITQEEADAALMWFVKSISEPLTRKHFNARTQAEFDAIHSWVFNIRHEKLERGEYSLPSLINLKARDIEAIVSKWIEYKNPNSIFEQGLYRRRLAEVCMFMGLPWHFALTAVLKRAGGMITNMTDPFFVIQMAEQAAEAVTVPIVPAKPAAPPVAPKPAEAPKPPPAVTPAPDAKPAETKPAATVKKPPSPNTKAPAEVGLDPNAGLKHVSESERAKGWMWKNLGIMLLRFSTLGMFGNGAMIASQTLMADQMLLNAVFELWVPLAINGGTLVTSYVAVQYGAFKEYQGRLKGSQALYV
jgi:GH24 family phage-related lysozyme (muramidase)